jgi:regulator of nucleoside diphosphate kinase
MKNRTIYITDFDLKRLREMILTWRRSDFSRRNDLEELEEELNRGRLVNPHNVPGNVITMNSTTSLMDLDTGEELIYTLVFPKDADIQQNKISILAPIGTAMLGYSVGDTFEWKVPDGIRRFIVKGLLYQPEASGHYHL